MPVQKKTPDYAGLNELASERNGGRILFATDDWFAVAENLLKDEDSVWKDNLYTTYGKWMDGWETRRKRIAGHDWAIIALGRPSIIKGVCVDTAFFTGNYAPRFSIQAARLSPTDESAFPKRISQIGSAPSSEDLETVAQVKTEEWTTLVSMTTLQSGYPETSKNYVAVSSDEKWTHLRLNIFPDGGIARLRVYGFAQPDWNILKSDTLVDLLSVENGGVCVGFSNAHYGHPRNLIKPGRGVNMGDGWETARKLDRPPVIEIDEKGMLQFYGNEWALFKLGHIGEVSSICIDTIHFKGNYPHNVQIEGTLVSHGKNLKNAVWRSILPPKKLSPDKEHDFASDEITTSGPINYVRVTIAPDGGISRVRLMGYVRRHHKNKIRFSAIGAAQCG